MPDNELAKNVFLDLVQLNNQGLLRGQPLFWSWQATST